MAQLSSKWLSSAGSAILSRAVASLLRSVHLLPSFGQRMPREWNSFSVLELCNTFYVNPFSDRDSYMIF